MWLPRKYSFVDWESVRTGGITLWSSEWDKQARDFEVGCWNFLASENHMINLWGLFYVGSWVEKHWLLTSMKQLGSTCLCSEPFFMVCWVIQTGERLFCFPSNCPSVSGMIGCQGVEHPRHLNVKHIYCLLIACQLIWWYVFQDSAVGHAKCISSWSINWFICNCRLYWLCSALQILSSRWWGLFHLPMGVYGLQLGFMIHFWISLFTHLWFSLIGHHVEEY